MIFKRFSLQRKKPELYLWTWLKAISSVKTKVLFGLGYYIQFMLRNNLFHKVWVDLINARQHKSQGFLGNIGESHGYKPILGAMSTSRKFQLLESDWITWLTRTSYRRRSVKKGVLKVFANSQENTFSRTSFW